MSVYQSSRMIMEPTTLGMSASIFRQVGGNTILGQLAGGAKAYPVGDYKSIHMAIALPGSGIHLGVMFNWYWNQVLVPSVNKLVYQEAFAVPGGMTELAYLTVPVRAPYLFINGVGSRSSGTSPTFTIWGSQMAITRARWGRPLYQTIFDNGGGTNVLAGGTTIINGLVPWIGPVKVWVQASGPTAGGACTINEIQYDESVQRLAKLDMMTAAPTTAGNMSLQGGGQESQLFDVDMNGGYMNVVMTATGATNIAYEVHAQPITEGG